MGVKLSRTVDVSLSAADIAQVFCEFDDDEQAQFFVHVARIMDGWGVHEAFMQRGFLAQHLAECKCVTDGAREFITDVATSMARQVA